MESIIIVGILTIIALTVVFGLKYKNEMETKQFFDEKRMEIDIDDYYSQEEEFIENPINTLQEQCIFTKDYIKFIAFKNPHIENILKAKELTRIYHYVFSKQTINAITSYTHKYIVLEFNTDFIFFIKDKTNQKKLPQIIKKNQEYTFDNTLINIDVLVVQLIKLNIVLTSKPPNKIVNIINIGIVIIKLILAIPDVSKLCVIR